MTSAKPALLVITGLRREAQIALGDGVVTLCSGGNPALLREKLSKLSPARPRESGDPEAKDWIPAFAGMSGGKIGAILSFGLAGGLAPHLRPGDVVIASHVIAGDERHEIHTGWHDAVVSSFGNAMTVHRGAIAGSDSVVTKTAHKAALHESNGALAVDMESHIAAAYARQHNLPFAVIRAISDPAARSLPDVASNALTADGDVALVKVMAGLLRQPGQLPALIAAGIDSERAFASLRRVRGLLGPLFGFRSANFR
jgi:hopanoid-associated phosphorylase